MAAPAASRKIPAGLFSVSVTMSRTSAPSPPFCRCRPRVCGRRCVRPDGCKPRQKPRRRSFPRSTMAVTSAARCLKKNGIERADETLTVGDVLPRDPMGSHHTGRQRSRQRPRAAPTWSPPSPCRPSVPRRAHPALRVRNPRGSTKWTIRPPALQGKQPEPHGRGKRPDRRLAHRDAGPQPSSPIEPSRTRHDLTPCRPGRRHLTACCPSRGQRHASIQPEGQRLGFCTCATGVADDDRKNIRSMGAHPMHPVKVARPEPYPNRAARQRKIR